MKKALSLFFALCLIGVLIPLNAAAVSVTATPNQSAVFINGTVNKFEAYTIDGSNYFKLRDMAYALNGTVKQFQVSFDQATNQISLTQTTPYTPVGGEMSVTGAKNSVDATAVTTDLYISGTPHSMNACVIGGYNYIKLRDLGALIDFSVAYYSEIKSIVIDTSKAYSSTADVGATDASDSSSTDRTPTPDKLNLVPNQSISDTANKAIQSDTGNANIYVINQAAGSKTTTQSITGSSNTPAGYGRQFQQIGGAVTTSQKVVTGNGGDYCGQYGGSADIVQLAIGGDGQDQVFHQIGGSKSSDMTVICGTGSASVTQWGGTGPSSMSVTETAGSDTLGMIGGPSNDTMMVHCTTGGDSGTIDGKKGSDTLIIYMCSGNSITLLKDSKTTLFKYGSDNDTTVLYVSNLQHYFVFDPSGNLVYLSY